MSLRVLLVAPLPPPIGGISIWTRAMLSYSAGQPDIEFIHVDCATRFRSIANLRMSARILSGALNGGAMLCRYIQAVVTNRVDVVHMTTSGMLGFIRNLVFICVARMANVPTVLHQHNGRLEAETAATAWVRVLAKWTFRAVDAAIVLDPGTARTVTRLAPKCPVSVIVNPAWNLAGPEIEVHADPLLPTVLFVGWIVPDKGVRELVRACADLIDPFFRLSLIGTVEPDMRNLLRKIASVRCNGDWLEVEGEIEPAEVAKRIRAAAMLVLPSYTEGAPNVVLEAMALGTPVIATPVGAIPQMLGFDTEEPCGLSVAVGSSEELARAIRTLLLNPSMGQQLARRAKERVKREYSPATVFAQYKAIWNAAAGKVRGARTLTP